MLQSAYKGIHSGATILWRCLSSSDDNGILWAVGNADCTWLMPSDRAALATTSMGVIGGSSYEAEDLS